jgi:hypothetical protein
MFRDIEAVGRKFQFEVRQLETDIIDEGTTMTFPNWDIKGVRERFYMENYVTVSEEEYLKSIRTLGADVVEYGITATDVARFIKEHPGKFEPVSEDELMYTELGAGS